MTKEEILKDLKTEGNFIDLTFKDDCLYCSATDVTYLFSEFEVIGKIDFTENSTTKTLHKVISKKHNLKGYFIE